MSPRGTINVLPWIAGTNDFHQYPIFDTTSMHGTHAPPGGPRPPPASGITMATSSAGRQTQYQQWGPARDSAVSASHNSRYHSYMTSAGRTSADQLSIFSTAFPSASSMSSHASHHSPREPHRLTKFPGGGFGGSGGPEGFHFPKPDNDHVIDDMFRELMQKRGWHNLPEQARRQMTAYPAAKKWTLLYQDRLTEWQGEQKRRQSVKPNQYSNVDFSQHADEEGSPEWYVRRVMDNSLDSRGFGSLEVNLRTQQIGWVKRFIECQGQVALTNVLLKINRRSAMGPVTDNTKGDRNLDREYDIVKCLKALMNNKFGADDALTHQQIIVALATSLISPRITTRKLVSEVLTFLCHWADGEGHLKVIQAMDVVKSQHGENGRFDAWMRLVEVTVDGRGKMGSLVGASEEMRSGGVGMENLLMEYAVASLILINMLIDAAEKDLQLRIHIRAQFTAVGIKRILTKMEAFQYDLIDKQIERFRTNEAIDYEDMLERENSSIKDSIEGEVKDLNDPVQIADAIQQRLQGSKTQDYFVSALQHLLLIRDSDGEERLRMFQLVDSMLSYVAMDRRLPDMDLKQSLNFTVQSLLDKLHTDSEARQALDEALEARQIADAAMAERDEMKERMALGADGLVAKLQKQLDEQSRFIEAQKRRVDSLRSELESEQALRAKEAQRNELETRELYLMLRDAQDVAASNAAKATAKLGKEDPGQMQGILDRDRLMERLQMQIERQKTQYKLEGRVWKDTVGPSDRLRALREEMDGYGPEAVGPGTPPRDDLTDSVLGTTVRRTTRIPRKPVHSGGEPMGGSPDEADEAYGAVEDEDGVLYEKPRLVEIKRPLMDPKQANGMFNELTGKVRRYDASDSEDGDGVTTVSMLQLELEQHRYHRHHHRHRLRLCPVSSLALLLRLRRLCPSLVNSLARRRLRRLRRLRRRRLRCPVSGLGRRRRRRRRCRRLCRAFNSTPSIGLPVVRPKKKLKALHWDKVDAPSTTHWAAHTPSAEEREEKYLELRNKGILDEVEKLFLAREIKQIGASSSKKDDKKQIISNDLRKAYEIALAKFSQYSVEKVVQMIIHCDKEVLDNNVVMDFLQKDDLCNIPDSVSKQMAPYSKDWTGPEANKENREQDPAELTRQDQIYLMTAFELHHYWKSRMRALALTRTYENDYDEITEKIQNVVGVSESLRDSVSLMNVLGLILDIGNYMNDANKQARGFKLSSLSRLGMVKDDKNESTLADLVERIVRNQYPEWESFTEDIGLIMTAQKINIEQLQTDARKYIDNVRNVQMSLDSGNLSDPKKFHPQDRVSQVVQRCMKEARRKAEQLQLYLDEMVRTYNDIMIFYGEDPTDDNARRDFFAKLASFVSDWRRSREKNIQLEETRRRNEASMKRKQHAQLKAATLADVGTGAGVASATSTGAMDSLLEKLRAAAPQTRDQRDRRRRARLKDRHQVRIASGQKVPDLNEIPEMEAGLQTGKSVASNESSAAADGEQDPTLLSPDAILSPTTSTGGGTGGDGDGGGEDDVAKRAALLLQGMRGGTTDAAEDAERREALRLSRRVTADEERKSRRRRREKANSGVSSNGDSMMGEGTGAAMLSPTVDEFAAAEGAGD
ncbi:hypothetical protein P8C59_004152 [Phyllachora maydis]|uniref:Cytokinesis protein sepA n=1 Tax=Phyllachora maydis TaxID=1825666 RepID=A0AAD9I2Z5_9PEZI|nr:hypothetical protein P8C59_004152 [Phyllachora maydis]